MMSRAEQLRAAAFSAAGETLTAAVLGLQPRFAVITDDLTPVVYSAAPVKTRWQRAHALAAHAGALEARSWVTGRFEHGAFARRVVELRLAGEPGHVQWAQECGRDVTRRGRPLVQRWAAQLGVKGELTTTSSLGKVEKR